MVRGFTYPFSYCRFFPFLSDYADAITIFLFLSSSEGQRRRGKRVRLTALSLSLFFFFICKMESNERRTDKYGKGSTKHQVENAARKVKKKKISQVKKKKKGEDNSKAARGREGHNFHFCSHSFSSCTFV